MDKDRRTIIKTNTIVWYNLFFDSFICIETPTWLDEIVIQKETDYWIRLGEI